MRRLLALALLLGVHGPASAETHGDVGIEEYSTPVESGFSGPEPVVSVDGYHFTTVVVGKESESVYVDAKKIAQGAVGDYSRPGTGVLAETAFVGGVSRDGRFAAHAVRARDAEGRKGYRLAINGAPVGKMFADILQVVVSPGGANVAFVAQTPDGKYLAVSAEGAGPSVEEPETIAGASDSGLVYRLVYGGKGWVYRDHKAAPGGDNSEIASSPDLSHVAALVNGPPQSVEVDGKELGRWKGIRSFHYAPNGDLVFLARTDPRLPDDQVDTFVRNGRETLLPAYKPTDHAPAARPTDGVSFLVENSGTYGVLRVGGRAMPELGQVLRAAEWVGFSPSGRHWAVVVSREDHYMIAVDGKDFTAAPGPLKSGRLIFDSETEFHYLGDSLGTVTLVCGKIGGEVSPRSVCAQHGAAMGKKGGLRAIEALAPVGVDAP